MPRLEAVCPNGHAYPLSIELGANVSDISFDGVSGGPCPVCGATGHVLDGRYDVVDNKLRRSDLMNAARAIADAKLTSRELKRLRELLASTDLDEEALRSRVAADVPAASGLLQWFRSPNGMAYSAWIQTIATVVALLITLIALRDDDDAAPPTPTQDQIEQIVGTVVDQYELPPRQQPRNETCACGSGQKFKRCHGR